jgi:hypothetical protein
LEYIPTVAQPNRQDIVARETVTLQDTLERLWPEVRRRHLYPELPFPRVAACGSRVALEMRNKQIVLDPNAVQCMMCVLPAETVLTALLDHAVSHYTFCPWDLSTHLRLYARAKEVLGSSDLARRATDLFMDVVADTHAVKERQSLLPLLYRHGTRTVLEEVVFSLYERIWGIDLNARGHEDTVRGLTTIPYLDRRRWVAGITRFIRCIRPLLDETHNRPPHEQSRMGTHGFQQYRPEQMERALRDFAGEAKSPEQFAEVFEDVQQELQASGRGRAHGMGRGAGIPADANRTYYMKLAENYALPLCKIPLQESGHLHPHSHRPWEACQPFHDIDPWSSFGKYLPGITQIWERRRGIIHGRKEKTPDCLLLIDSSGSMVDPVSHLSYAVLGGGCAADAYLRHDARVAVYNFSDAHAGGRDFLAFSRNRSLIYRVLCRYFGGGTALNLEEITQVARESEADIFLITDMQITNLDQTISRFSRLENRLTAVHIGKKPGALRFMKAVSHRENISVFGVNEATGIPRIVLGSARSYLAPYRG